MIDVLIFFMLFILPGIIVLFLEIRKRSLKEKIEYFPEQRLAKATFKARRLGNLPPGVRSPKTINQLFNRQLFQDAMKIIYKILDSPLHPDIEKIRIEAVDNLVDVYGKESEGPVLSIEAERDEIARINRRSFDVVNMYKVCSVIFKTNDQYDRLEVKTHDQLEKEGIKIEKGVDIETIYEEAQLKERRREIIPKKVRDEVWRRDRGKCVECGSQENLEFDHIIPVSKGGSNTARNIQLLCEKCNRKKLNKI